MAKQKAKATMKVPIEIEFEFPEGVTIKKEVSEEDPFFSEKLPKDCFPRIDFWVKGAKGVYSLQTAVVSIDKGFLNFENPEKLTGIVIITF